MSDLRLSTIRDRVLDRPQLIKATFSDADPASGSPWKKVVVRPVLVRGRALLQFSYFDATRDISKNYDSAAAPARLDEVLALSFRHMVVESTASSLHASRTPSGKLRLREAARATPAPRAEARHDHRKNVALPADRPDRFLQVIGVAGPDGRIKAGQHDKHRQINDFLKLVTESLDLSSPRGQPLSMVDCGCGAAYLTFAAHHHLHSLFDTPVTTTGVDVRADLMERHEREVRELGWDDLTFIAATIADYAPPTAPDIVLALHACDTATDDALAGGIGWGASYIFSAPCCHHHLQAQIERIGAPSVFAPVFRYGILGERSTDILTDALRALILRVMGYRTDVVQFVSAEHTARNIMIRAVRTAMPASVRRQAAAEYRALTAFWGVEPYLVTVLGDAFTAALDAPVESRR